MFRHTAPLRGRPKPMLTKQACYHHHPFSLHMRSLILSPYIDLHMRPLFTNIIRNPIEGTLALMEFSFCYSVVCFVVLFALHRNYILSTQEPSQILRCRVLSFRQAGSRVLSQALCSKAINPKTRSICCKMHWNVRFVKTTSKLVMIVESRSHELERRDRRTFDISCRRW